MNMHTSIEPAVVASTPSLILGLHARYETAWDEHKRLDEGQPRKPEDPRNNEEQLRRYYGCEEGMRNNEQETDLLRAAILWQIPTTDEEATVIAYHLWSLYDPQTTYSDGEKKALEVGLTNLFDYLVSEGRADMEAMGREFSTGALIAYKHRRYRTGLLPDDD